MSLAIVGGGPVGLALALRTASRLPGWNVSLFDGRRADDRLANDTRTIALSLGSVQLLRRLQCWPAEQAQLIRSVQVSEQHGFPRSIPLDGRTTGVEIRADDEAVPMLGAVVAYPALVNALQDRWFSACTADPARLKAAFGTSVRNLRPIGHQVEVDAEVAERFDLVVIAEGGVFAEQGRKPIHRDYGQSAWVGTLRLPEAAPPGVAYERFTRHGPAALLPLPGRRAALVWCVDSQNDPVGPLNDAQRLSVLNSIFPPELRPLSDISALKRFALGLNAERTLSAGRMVRIGNAAQTLHPVAGQGLNLGLRDAWELAESLGRHADVDVALRRLEWRRAPDRWATIAATDFLARSFTWQLPGAAAARSLGLAAVQAFGPLKSALARQMMFGRR
jgi:2-octaprenyl-6-methoxyphenol hydroxylase